MRINDLEVMTDDKILDKQKKTTSIYVKVSPEERAKLERNMAIIGATNISAFVRRMCLDGGIFKVDVPEIQEIGRLMNITANNINQISKRVNYNGNIYRDEITETQSQLTECRELLGKVMSRLSKIS